METLSQVFTTMNIDPSLAYQYTTVTTKLQHRPLIILITGPPNTAKLKLASQLASRLLSATVLHTTPIIQLLIQSSLSKHKNNAKTSTSAITTTATLTTSTTTTTSTNGAFPSEDEGSIITWLQRFLRKDNILKPNETTHATIATLTSSTTSSITTTTHNSDTIPQSVTSFSVSSSSPPSSSLVAFKQICLLVYKSLHVEITKVC